VAAIVFSLDHIMAKKDRQLLSAERSQVRRNFMNDAVIGVMARDPQSFFEANDNVKSNLVTGVGIRIVTRCVFA